MIGVFHAQNRKTGQIPTVITLGYNEDSLTLYPEVLTGMTILDSGDSEVTEFGILFSKSDDPSYGDRNTTIYEIVSGIYYYNNAVIDLFGEDWERSDLYCSDFYYRAFAKNSYGIGLGNIINYHSHSDHFYADLICTADGSGNFSIVETIYQTYDSVDRNITIGEIYFSENQNPFIDTVEIFYTGFIRIGQDDLPYIYNETFTPTLLESGKTYYYRCKLVLDKSSVCSTDPTSYTSIRSLVWP